jgi:copper chaperone NosL
MYYGADVCASCKMTIVDQQHAAQLVTTKGKVFKYDAIECMLRAKDADEEYQVILVNNYLDPGKLMEAKTATFLVSPAMPSPMGANLSALPTEVEAEALQNRVGGELFSWDEIRQNIISIHVSSN